MRVLRQPEVWQDPLALLAMMGLCALLLYPPYLRALFFTSELLPTHLLTSAVFIMWWIVKYRRGESSFVSEPLDYFVLGFTFAYLLSFTVAVNLRGAIHEFLKVANYFMVYWLVSQLARENKVRVILLHVLAVGALGVAVLGLGAAAGTWEVHGGYARGRIFSTLQYPNSLAAYLTGAFFVTLGLLQNAGKRLKLPYALAAYLLFVTTLLTYSRGGWLIVPVFAAAYLVFVPREKRAGAFWLMAVIFSVSAALLPLLGRAYMAENGALAWLLVLAGAAAVLSLQYLIFYIVKKIRPAVAWGALGIMVVLAGVVSGVFIYKTLSQPLLLSPDGKEAVSERPGVKPGTEYTLSAELFAEADSSWSVIVGGQKDDGFSELLLDQSGTGSAAREFAFSTPADVQSVIVRIMSDQGEITVGDVVLAAEGEGRKLSFTWNRLLPDLLYRRLFGLRLQERNVQERFVFYRDAVEIIKDYPLLGAGGQAWKSLYPQYQSEQYITTEVHNHFLQVWVEAGLIGFLLFLGLWASLLHTVYRVLRTSEDTGAKVLAVAVTTGAMAVVTHSLYDFNLSLGAIGIFVWALAGMARSMLPERKADWSPYKNMAAMGAAACLFVFVLSLNAGHSALRKGSALVQSNPREAVVLLERAVQLDRFDSDVRAALAAAYEMLGAREGDRNYLVPAEEQHDRAIALNRFHPGNYSNKGVFLVRSGDFAGGLEYLAQAIELHPFYHGDYTLYGQAALFAARQLLADGEQAAAEELLLQVLPVEDKMKEYFEDTSAMAYVLGEAYYLLGDYVRAEQYLDAAYDVDADRANAAAVLSLIAGHRGEKDLADSYLEQALEWDPGSMGVYEALKMLDDRS